MTELEIGLTVPESLLDALAERVARRVLSQLTPPQASSPWLDVEGALAFLPFSRDQLYKLTSAKAIPFRKKRGGQGLLFHRGELERWLQVEYEPTGCAGEVELWSSTTQLTGKCPGGACDAPGPGNGGDSSDADEG